MKIELFTEVNFRGPTAKNGKCIALVECETKKGPAVKAQIETEQKTTYHRMSMIAILTLEVINGEKYILVKADGDINANGIILENREGEKDEEEDD